VERPQPEARTNDVDAGDDWRRIAVEEPLDQRAGQDTAVTVTIAQ
jgi:hypothetical protein